MQKLEEVLSAIFELPASDIGGASFYQRSVIHLIPNFVGHGKVT